MGRVFARASGPHGTPPMEPILDLGAEPDGGAAVTEGDNRAWHVGISALVAADAVAVRQAEKLGDAVRVDQVLGPDKRHKKSLYDR